MEDNKYLDLCISNHIYNKNESFLILYSKNYKFMIVNRKIIKLEKVVIIKLILLYGIDMILS